MADKFTLVKKGYEPTEVDAYIATLESVLKSYKEKDTAIKNAIINAQIAADNILRNAELEAEKLKTKASIQLEDISSSITAQKSLIKEFQDEYNAMISKYLHNFNDADMLKIYSKINEMEEYFTKLQSNPSLMPAEVPEPDEADETDETEDLRQLRDSLGN